jgi:epoxide hydrolase-like predicted phosphatase
VALKAIIFDFGDVLVRTLDESRRRAWEQRLGLAVGEAERIVFDGEQGSAYQRGEVTDAAQWRWIQARLGLGDADLARFQQDFFADDVLDTALLAYIARLRPHYHIGLLSNAGNNARWVFGEKYGVLDCFDSVTISAEEGVMKPDPRIFEIALTRAGVQHAEALFIDDSARNIAGAAALGIATIHYVDPIAARRELVRLTGVPDDVTEAA